MAQSAQFRWEGRAWLTRSKAAARKGVELALEHTLAEARKIVPLDEGTLERSGIVLMAPSGPQGAIVFDTPYARRQHEELTWKHAPGRQAKYLEGPMNREKEAMLAIIAATIRREGGLRGGRG
ncbi:hypothetical protein BX265_4948 [Streptomyces sp. TLI_235]|nr:hypothetical protein [Streptomyces sp. TLI_235]PBC80112.1 hypothetical protein BX265_4948 [Streptomyces sp. TLI_235]